MTTAARALPFHRSVAILVAVVALGSPNGARAAKPTGDAASLKLAIPSGWVVTPDLTTLIVSVSSDAKLVYFDTVTNSRVKEVELEFKPAALAIQGGSLFAATAGGASVYALDLQSGKVLKQFDVPDAAVAGLACHPKAGLVYASSGSRKVYSLDPATGKVRKTDAVGTFLAVDPVKGDALYTGIQPPIADATFLIMAGPDGGIKIIQDVWGVRSVMLKYDVTPQGLKFAAAQRNAAVNGQLLRMTPDGQRVTVLGGGGWRPPAEGGTGGGYVAALFSTKDLQTMSGQAPHGRDIAFHPVLPLGVVNHQGGDLTVFHAKSLVTKGEIKAPSGAGHGGELLTFGGKGTKVVFWNAEGLQLAPLALTAEDREALAKAYGKLPPPPEALEFKPGPTAAALTPSAQARARGGVLAEAGFNDAKGINADKAPGSPYPLGQTNREGGRGEPGWEGPWPASPNAEYQADVVAEGDGAVRLLGTVGFGRRLKAPIQGAFRVVQRVRVPADGGFACYVQGPDGRAETSGPIWGVDRKGRGFQVLDGDESGSGRWVPTNVQCKEDTWYEVTIEVDVAAKRWGVLIDGKKFDHPGIHFRGQPKSFQSISYLVETPGGLFLDGVRVIADGNSKETGMPKTK